MEREYDVIVVGGGAAGLMAAGTAASCGARTLLLEKMEKNGRKIRITGKGRCNLTNDKPAEEFLSHVRSGAEFVGEAFRRFSNADTVLFFERIGLPLTVERGGRVFPRSGDAWDVVRALEGWCGRNGVRMECFAEVSSVDAGNGAVTGVTLSGGSRIPAPRVIVATGGFSYPTTGSTGDGCRFAYNLGHDIVPVRPSLVPFEIAYERKRELRGLLLKNVELFLSADGRERERVRGEVEFFGFGIGGAATFRLSRRAVDALDEGAAVAFGIDLKPALSGEKLRGRFAREREKEPKLTVEGLMRKLMPGALVPLVLSQTRIPAGRKAAELTEGEEAELARLVKNVRLDVIDHRGFREAVVTAGGVELSQVDARTMESKLVKGLFFAGEVLDLDADTGGYNLQLAFSTGRLAGQWKK